MTIAHVDMDAFFASVAVRDRPELRGRPVVIANSRARSVVAAASYPARSFGIRSAMPLSEATRLCRDLIVLPAEMDRYRKVSAQVMEVLGGFSDRVEVAGLDEAYLDLSSSPAPKARARSLKAEVRSATGLTCSIGLGPNKLIAKVASDRDKPDGLCHLTVQRYTELIADFGVRVIPGVGPKTEARLNAEGVTTVAELASASREQLCERIGSVAADLIDRANGIDDREMETSRVRKSESRERTFEHDIDDRPTLERVLAELVGPVLEGLEAEGLQGRTATVKVRFAPFSTRTRSITVRRPFATTAELIEVGLGLLRELLDAHPAPVRLIGIGVSSLKPAGSVEELVLF